MWKIPAVLALVAAIAVPVESRAAEVWSGPWLHEICGPSAEQHQKVACIAFVVGIHRAAVVNSVMSSFSEQQPSMAQIGLFRYCIPRGATYSQKVDIVAKWTSENPEQRHLPPELQVLSALTAAFPCE